MFQRAFVIKNKNSCKTGVFMRARDGTRTRGLDLGKVALHQLSHSRISQFIRTNNNIHDVVALVNYFFYK